MTYVFAFMITALLLDRLNGPAIKPPTKLTTWADFLRSPLPMFAEDVPMRSDRGDDMTATVFNRAAALQRMRHGREL